MIDPSLSAVLKGFVPTNDLAITYQLNGMQDRLNVVHNCVKDIVDEINTLQLDILRLRKLNIVKQKGETPNDPV